MWTVLIYWLDEFNVLDTAGGTFTRWAVSATLHKIWSLKISTGYNKEMTPEMNSCSHKTLVLLPEKKSRLQCRHCHLTITSAELGDGFCPECYETHNEKRYDFDEMDTEESGPARYRCEDCGVIIESN